METFFLHKTLFFVYDDFLCFQTDSFDMKYLKSLLILEKRDVTQTFENAKKSFFYLIVMDTLENEELLLIKYGLSHILVNLCQI